MYVCLHVYKCDMQMYTPMYPYQIHLAFIKVKKKKKK